MNPKTRKRVLILAVVVLLIGVFGGMVIKPISVTMTGSEPVTHRVDGDALDVHYSGGSIDTARRFGGDTVFVSANLEGRVTGRTD